MAFFQSFPSPSSSSIRTRQSVLGNDDDVDPDSAALIARLILEDVEEVSSMRKGKSRYDAPLTDEEIAYQLQSAQINEWLGVVEDAKAAKSLSEALTLDAVYLDALITAEEAALADRRAAEGLSRGEALPAPIPCQARLQHPAFVMDPDPPMLVPSPTRELDVDEGKEDCNEASGDDSDETVFNGFASRQQGPLTGQPPRPSGAAAIIKQKKNLFCTICDEIVRMNNSLPTSCGHYYCRSCVVDLVEAFTTDEKLYPLRCCQEPILVTAVMQFLSVNLRQRFEAKHAEFSVLTKDRVYCSTPTCSFFLGSSEGVIADGILCPRCSSSTCPQCKEPAHIGENCEINTLTKQVRDMALQEGWQTCPGCHNVVELNMGCFHMTCLCRTQFCYLCAMPWKSCPCPQWDETRLLATAQQRVENVLGERQLRRTNAEELARHVTEQMDNLRVNHNCDRHSWRYRSGGGRCEECYYTLPQYLMICNNCSLLVCRRCSRNRV